MNCNWALGMALRRPRVLSSLKGMACLCLPNLGWPRLKKQCSGGAGRSSVCKWGFTLHKEMPFQWQWIPWQMCFGHRRRQTSLHTNEATLPGNCHGVHHQMEISGRIQEWLRAQTLGSGLEKSWTFPFLALRSGQITQPLYRDGW